MRLGDRAKDLYKVFREHTPEIRVDQKNVRQGYTVTEQSEIDGKYEIENAGDENGWGFWKHGKAENPAIEPKENSRVVNLSEFQEDKEISESLESREMGTYFQACPVVMKLDGIYAISDGGIDNQLEAKKILNLTPNNYTEIKNILGYDVPCGMTGLLVQSLNQDKHEQYFIPSGNILSVDHSFGGLSSRIVDTKNNGHISDEFAALDSFLRLANDENNAKVVGINCSKSGKDTTGYGITIFKEDAKNIIAYMSKEKGGFIHPGNLNDKHKFGENENAVINPAHIDTNANFYMDEVRDGALDFETGGVPVLSDPEPEFYSRVRCRWSSARNKWTWYVGMSTGIEAMTVARIRWNVTLEEDLSEAEILEEVDGVLQPTGILVWIDWLRSLSTYFTTAGNNTLFRLKLKHRDIVKKGTLRDLYYASYCLEDFGLKITHSNTLLYQNRALEGVLLSQELFFPVWENNNLASIKTTINNEDQINVIKTNIPKQWKPQAQDFKYLELSGLAQGLQSLFRPIEPVPDDPVSMPKTYRSYKEKDGEPIAWYEVE